MEAKTINSRVYVSLLVILLVGLLWACGDPDASKLASFPLERALANGKPTLAEFGWRKCIPCKEMRRILEELDEEYKGKLNVLIVEIPYHEDLADKYEVKVIPVQILFDSKGKEVARHAGFLAKEQIIPQLELMGITK